MLLAIEDSQKKMESVSLTNTNSDLTKTASVPNGWGKNVLSVLLELISMIKWNVFPFTLSAKLGTSGMESASDAIRDTSFHEEHAFHRETRHPKILAVQNGTGILRSVLNAHLASSSIERESVFQSILSAVNTQNRESALGATKDIILLLESVLKMK